MLDIARENSLSETAFTVKNQEDYVLRWFTPGGEIDLCGHATLATAYILFHFYGLDNNTVSFKTKSGTLIVRRKADLYEMDMPAYSLKSVPVTEEMEEAIGFRPLEAWMGRDLVCVLKDEEQVLQANPNENALKRLKGLLLHLTTKGRDFDCVTRSFAPKLNIYEDPVCGSGHCHVVPLWAEKLGKAEVCAFQGSKRTGILYCQMNGKRVLIAGKAVLYAVSELFISNELMKAK